MLKRIRKGSKTGGHSDNKHRRASPTVNMSILYREMTIEDYEQVYSLWEGSAGIGLSDADSRENIAQYLAHNPGMSFVAYEGETLVGAVLCGHDGRRGYLYHLAVRESHQRNGLGGDLVKHCISVLAAQNIQKCHIFVFKDNDEGIQFWEKVGWELRVDLVINSKYTKM